MTRIHTKKIKPYLDWKGVSQMCSCELRKKKIKINHYFSRFLAQVLLTNVECYFFLFDCLLSFIPVINLAIFCYFIISDNMS